MATKPTSASPTPGGGTAGAISQPAHRNHLTGLVDLEERCFPRPLHRPWRRSELEGFLDSRHHAMWIVQSSDSDGQIDAYTLFSLVVDEAELLRIGVRPQARRRGLAAGLLDDALCAIKERGLTVVRLEVRADNRAALALYRRFDFVEVARRKSYYPDGADAVMLQRGESP